MSITSALRDFRPIHPTWSLWWRFEKPLRWERRELGMVATSHVPLTGGNIARPKAMKCISIYHIAMIIIYFSITPASVLVTIMDNDGKSAAVHEDEANSTNSQVFSSICLLIPLLYCLLIFCWIKAQFQCVLTLKSYWCWSSCQNSWSVMINVGTSGLGLLPLNTEGNAWFNWFLQNRWSISNPIE